MTVSVLRLEARDVPDVVDVLSDAFEHYPVMQLVLDAKSPGYSRRLRRFIHFATMARVYRDEFLFGIRVGGILEAAALVSWPARQVTSPELVALREETWHVIGADARARYDAYNAAAAAFMPPESHLHLNMIGVRHAAHGKGHARALLERVHTLSRDEPGSAGVSLTTEVEANVRLYQHFGYTLMGDVEFSPGFTCWGFYRANGAG